MNDAIARVQAASAKAKRQRDNWKRRAEEAEARLLEIEMAMENTKGEAPQ